jgi:hypothetical protein
VGLYHGHTGNAVSDRYKLCVCVCVFVCVCVCVCLCRFV